jgi:hypothetical protein
MRDPHAQMSGIRLQKKNGGAGDPYVKNLAAVSKLAWDFSTIYKRLGSVAGRLDYESMTQILQISKLLQLNGKAARTVSARQLRLNERCSRYVHRIREFTIHMGLWKLIEHPWCEC